MSDDLSLDDVQLGDLSVKDALGVGLQHLLCCFFWDTLPAA